MQDNKRKTPIAFGVKSQVIMTYSVTLYYNSVTKTVWAYRLDASYTDGDGERKKPICQGHADMLNLYLVVTLELK